VAILVVLVVLGLLGAIIIAGFVVLAGMLRALAQGLREARQAHGEDTSAQLGEVGGKLQGMRLDLHAQRLAIEALTLELRGPPSLRQPPIYRTPDRTEG